MLTEARRGIEELAQKKSIILRHDPEILFTCVITLFLSQKKSKSIVAKMREIKKKKKKEVSHSHRGKNLYMWNSSPYTKYLCQNINQVPASFCI